MSESVAAVVVTYNRKALLLECIQGLLRQSRKLDKIFIIDNFSSDGTTALLEESGILGQEQVQYIRLGENSGGAGGFHHGVKVAHEAGFDWLWLMDDDVVPEDQALEKQIQYRDISKCIHPRKRFEDGSFFDWEQVFHPGLADVYPLHDASFKNGKEWCSVNIGCFEGMLLHSSLIPKIGLPDTRFFICYDDTIYGFLASQHTNVIYVRDAVLIKKIRPPEGIAEKKIYFTYRNYFLKIEHLKKLGVYNRALSTTFHSLILVKLLWLSLFQRKFFKVTKAVFYSYKDAYNKKFGLGTYKG